MGKITHPCVSLFLPSPDDSETLQVPDSKLYGAPVLAKEGGLSLGQGPAFSRLRLKRGIVLGWGPRTPPLLFLSRCSNILSVPTGAIWPHLLLLGAYRLHTAGKGMNLSRSPSLSQATPWGVTPPILFPLQEGAIRIEGWTLSCSCGLSAGRRAVTIRHSCIWGSKPEEGRQREPCFQQAQGSFNPLV